MKALGGWSSTGPGKGKWVLETDVDAILVVEQLDM